MVNFFELAILDTRKWTGEGGGQIPDLQTSFLGRGTRNADGCRHEGGRGQK